MDKRIWLASLLAAGAVGGLARSEYERDCLATEKTVIRSRKIKRPRTVVFLTDLHDKEFGQKNDRLLTEIRRLQPDFALIGGDTMVAKEDRAKLDVTEGLLAGLEGYMSGLLWERQS